MIMESSTNSYKHERFWTKAILRESLDLMMKEKRLEIPATPNFSYRVWLKQQTASVHTLVQRARKNTWKPNRTTMDNMETQVWQPGVQDGTETHVESYYS